MNIFSKSALNYTNKVNFNVKTLEKGHHNMLYKGIPILKCPFDYVIYQMIFWEVRPDLVIEIGTNRGGSVLYFADLLDLIGHGEIHTIDIENLVFDEVKEHKRIKFFSDGFENYNVENTKAYKRILVIDDGSHVYEDVEAILQKFSPIVSKDSYLIIEDGIIDELGWSQQYNGGPNKAIKEFVSESDKYVIDRKWCDFFGVNATFNTNGYLKRVK